MKTLQRPATNAEISKIVGPLNDAVVVEIIGTGASADEVLEAFTWLTADDQIATETERGPSGAVLRALEILQGEDPQADER